MITQILDDRDPAVVYSLGWVYAGSFNEFYGTTTFAEEPGLTATVVFHGIQVSVYGTLGPRNAERLPPQSSYSVDGSTPVIYQALQSSYIQYNTRFYVSPILSNGQHTLVVTNLLTSDPLFIDYFLVLRLDTDRSSSQSVPGQSPIQAPAAFTLERDASSENGSKGITMIFNTGPDHSQNFTNTNPYTNYGQHASGGRIDNIHGHGEGRRSVSAQGFDPPDSRPSPERFQSSPAVIETSLHPLRPTSRDGDVKATHDIFAELWSQALEGYKEKTGFDIQDRKNKFVQLFVCCEDTGDALAVLEDLPVFKKPGARTTWVKIKDSLKKVFDVVILLNSSADEVGNVALPHFGTVIFIGTGLLLMGTKDIAKHSEPLEKLFSRLAAFICRLEILIELLNTLTIATVMVKGNFWNKVETFSKKLFSKEEEEIEKALVRLSDLTEEGSAMILAELLASRADFDELVKELGHFDVNVKGLASQIRSVIGNLENKELNGLSDLFRSRGFDDNVEVLRIIHRLKIEHDGTQPALSRIETEVRKLRRSLARMID